MEMMRNLSLMSDKTEVYIIDPMGYPGDQDRLPECPGNDTLEWYWLDYTGEDDPFNLWVEAQLPSEDRPQRVLLEWCW